MIVADLQTVTNINGNVTPHKVEYVYPCTKLYVDLILPCNQYRGENPKYITKLGTMTNPGVGSF